MKRVLLFTPLLLLLVGCGNGGRHHPRPLATSPTRVASIGDVPLRLDVTGVIRHGRTAELQMRLTNRAAIGTDSFEIADTFSSESYGDFSGISVVDGQSGRPVRALDDSSDVYNIEVAPGGSQQLLVPLLAPTGKSADVLVPHFGLFRDVPVRDLASTL